MPLIILILCNVAKICSPKINRPITDVRYILNTNTFQTLGNILQFEIVYIKELSTLSSRVS